MYRTTKVVYVKGGKKKQNLKAMLKYWENEQGVLPFRL